MLVISSIVAVDLLALYYVLFIFFFLFFLYGDLRLFTRRKHDEIPRQLPVSACCGGTSSMRLLHRVFQKGDPVGSKELASRVNHLNAQVGFYFIPVF